MRVLHHTGSQKGVLASGGFTRGGTPIATAATLLNDGVGVLIVGGLIGGGSPAFLGPVKVEAN